MDGRAKARRLGAAAKYALLVALAVAAARAAMKAHTLAAWTDTKDAGDARVAAGVAMVPWLPLDGFGPDGAYVAPERRDSTRVAFVLRGNSLAADVAFWRRVRGAIADSSSLPMLGACDGEACAALVRKLPAQPPFPVLAAGQYLTMWVLSEADARGDAVLIGRGGAELGRVAWRSEPAREVAQEIARLQLTVRNDPKKIHP